MSHVPGPPRNDPRHDGPELWDPVRAAVFPETRPRLRNDRWAARIGLDALDDAGWIHFGRFEPLPGSFPDPLGAALPPATSSACTIPASEALGLLRGPNARAGHLPVGAG